jgi:hypothetical protein
MVIRQFHIISVALAPYEADPKLIVDPDAVLPLAIPLESFQPVAPQCGEVRQLACGIDHAELLESLPGTTLKTSASARREQPLGFAIAERLDQV